MRKLKMALVAAIVVTSASIPQAAFATSPEAKQYAYQQCSGGQWAELGYGTFNECTYYKIQEYEINHL